MVGRLGRQLSMFINLKVMVSALRSQDPKHITLFVSVFIRFLSGSARTRLRCPHQPKHGGARQRNKKQSTTSASKRCQESMFSFLETQRAAPDLTAPRGVLGPSMRWFSMRRLRAQAWGPEFGSQNTQKRGEN